ncbi:MAG TPA: hypothetical protein VEG30_17585 [Terriglobales bacterium]|nr:hypothetical protein [Terriglobales bacterium]
MILFLKTAAGEQANADGTARAEWKSPDIIGDIKASVVWIDGDHLYRFTQPINPGPSVLSELPGSEATIRKRVEEIAAIQEDMKAALSFKDGSERAGRLKPYVNSQILPVQQFALEQLGQSGPAAVSAIREMLDDPAYADEASELVKALVLAGGRTVGEELNRRLRQDLAFWKSTGPSLSQGWWNEDARIHAPLRERYSQTYQLILGLQETRYPPALETATELRDFWRSLPQLNDPSGLNEIADECNKLIQRLRSDRDQHQPWEFGYSRSALLSARTTA